MPKALTLSVADETLADLDRLASEMLRPREEVVEEALRSFIELQGWQMGRIRRGLADADAGRFVADETIEGIRTKYDAGS